MTTINNPVAQLAHLYNLLETELRRRSLPVNPISLKELNEKFQQETKSPWQIRDCISTFKKKGHLTTTFDGKTVLYMWNVLSDPFIFGKRTLNKIRTQPSKPTVTDDLKATGYCTFKPSQKDIELIFEQTLVIVGRNLQTGRIRITIEDIK
jgi:hypothetical protein